MRRRGVVLLAALARALGDVLTEDDLAFRLAPKETRCVYEELEDGQSASLSVFVLSGGNMDVTVNVEGPFERTGAGLPRTAHRRGGGEITKPHSSHAVTSDRDDADFATPTVLEISAPDGPAGGGVYKICFDNTASRLSEKIVTLGVTKSAGAEDALPVWEPIRLRHDGADGAADGAAPKKNSENVAKLEKRVVTLRSHLAILKEKQTRERRRLAHHKALYDAKHNTMVEGSLFETVVYILCSIFQIVFVRRWFSGKGVLPTYGGDHHA